MLKMSLITFFDSVVNNDTTAVIKYLARSSGNKRAKQLAIVYAAAIGNTEMVKAMLEDGMNANTWDVFTDFKRAWEPMKLKKIQAIIWNDMKPFTRGWAPVLTPACVAAFYGHKNVLEILCKHDFTTMSFNPYFVVNSTFIGEGNPPEWNAATCALFGQQWDIASALIDRGVMTTDMEEQHPLFLEFRTKVKIPKDVINIIFSFL